MSKPPKNIVICCDGTGNDYSHTESNVMRLFRFALKNDPRQVTCYHPGIGTLPRPEGRTEAGRTLRRWTSLWLGTGAIENVVALYSYLMREYEPGDRVFLFGFSRGAFIVRALAGMLHVTGLLRREDEHLVPYAAGLYQSSERRIKRAKAECGTWPPQTKDGAIDHAASDRRAALFKSKLSRTCDIHFMGLFDTVKAYGWLQPRSFPALRHNPSVKAVRHAVALDERRSAFQVTGWGDRDARDVPLDRMRIKEVWFAGDHSDVGGGPPAGNSPLTDITLAWMLGEATNLEADEGLLLDGDSRDEVMSIAARSHEEVTSAKARDLLRELQWRSCQMVPLRTLDNAEYPPRRGWYGLPYWSSGRRQPGKHDEDRDVLFHDTVDIRASTDKRPSPRDYLARARHVKSEPPDCRNVCSSPITGYASSLTRQMARL
jgi:type VI secretion system (T6SS) phospholipase Tle1-like effector